MYVEPSSNIKLLRGVDLCNNYRHTIYFDDDLGRREYFIDKVKHNLTAQTYQRISNGLARVELSYDEVEDCDYMMFQNTAYGLKWFYAFITSCEYINNSVTEIRFELDVMQTYFNPMYVEIMPCLVEREHSASDVVGENVVHEDIEIGDIVCSEMGGTSFFDSYIAVIATAYDPDGQAGGTVSGLFTGLHYVAGLVDNAEQVKKLLDFLDSAVEANKADSIVNIFLMPTAFYTTDSIPSVQVTTLEKPTTIGNYTPRNKKLLTYPFNFLGVDCGNNDAVYRYEYFKTEKCNFTMTGTVTNNPEIALVPMNYNGNNYNYIEKLVMNGFPQVAFSVDSFKQWVARESSKNQISAIGSTAMYLSGTATLNIPLMVAGAIGSASATNNMILAYNSPPQARGTTSGSTDVATRTKNFWFKKMHVNEEYAKIIDGYFDMYGYAVNQVKVPNLRTRRYWNYVKTNGCQINGNINSEARRKICEIFDKGITFWRAPFNFKIGDYSLDNIIVNSTE